MKLLKIIIVFLLVLGGVVGAFFIKSNNHVNKIKIDDSTLQQYRDKIDAKWDNAADWDERVFNDNCEYIQQLSKSKNVNSLHDLNTARAVDKVYEHIVAEWSKPDCSKSVIDKYVKAVRTIKKKEEDASSNPSVVLIDNIYDVYAKARGLALKDFGLTPKFDGYDWNSFEGYEQSIRSQRDAILSNTYYKEYLSSISEISDGLNGVSSRISKAQRNFYNELAEQIVDYFKSEKMADERTRADLNRLRNVKGKFEREYISNSNLNAFAEAYSDDVSYNEDRETSDDLSRYPEL